jgi:hypothetical protein
VSRGELTIRPRRSTIVPRAPAGASSVATRSGLSSISSSAARCCSAPVPDNSHSTTVLAPISISESNPNRQARPTGRARQRPGGRRSPTTFHTSVAASNSRARRSKTTEQVALAGGCTRRVSHPTSPATFLTHHTTDRGQHVDAPPALGRDERSAARRQKRHAAIPGGGPALGVTHWIDNGDQMQLLVRATDAVRRGCTCTALGTSSRTDAFTT